MVAGSLDTESKTAWISQGFERLIDRVRQTPQAVHFDVLIIGSGYGGAFAASTFAGRQHNNSQISVAVLERGKEYLPGAFPTGLSELPGHVLQSHTKDGLFDVRLGSEVNVLVANGVGGGSLINAGVMEIPAPYVFTNGWPNSLQTFSNWSTYFERAGDMLGATSNGIPNTIESHVDGVPQKFQSIKALAPQNTFHPAAVTVAMKDNVNFSNVALNKCVRCGDCATGCNFGAKNSHDVNLLARAQQAGAEIFSGATVRSIEKDGTDWIVNCVHTRSDLRKRDGDVLKIRARKVVLAAGTLGSTEILLRSSDAGLSLSDAQLGKRCSTNGDMLITDYATNSVVNTVADETIKPSARAIGPTITGVIDLRATQGVVIEEMSVPAALRVAFKEVFATVNTLHSLAEIDPSQHTKGFPASDVYAASDARVANSALYAVMGDDGAAGTIEIKGDLKDVAQDGIARMRRSQLPDLPLYDDQVKAVAELVEDTGGRIIPNPVWKLLPEEMSWLLKNQRGPLTTVHPLGGCVMGDTGASGVVDEFGRVFSDSVSSNVHDGLVVLDGSIIPTALGTNPSLTISAVALRAAESLAVKWGYDDAPPAASAPPLVRPRFRLTDQAAQIPTTEVEIIERLAGPVAFRPHNGTEETRIVELTLRFDPRAIAQLSPEDGGNPILQVAANNSDFAIRSRIRIFQEADWTALQKSWTPPRLMEQKLDAIAEFSAPLTGSLRVFERESSSVLGRIWRAGTAWLLNRGLRDIYQAIVDSDGGPDPLSRIHSGLAVASRAGEIRSFGYNLKIGAPDATSKYKLDGNSIVGAKTFTYSRRGNPWRQLLDVALSGFPGLSQLGDASVLKVDVSFLARIGVPLFRITRQRDGVSALAELVTFLGYAARLLLGIHIWSFRAPDKDTDPGNDVLNLLPPIKLPLSDGSSVNAEIHDIPIPAEKPQRGDNPVAGVVRLTRYPNPASTKRPVIMIHGYSAGGTTFAHHAVNPNFASFLWESGRDVWVADLRTSSGHPNTATLPWSFDQIGKTDVPVAIQAVRTAHGGGQVDVVAHCMGTVVFSIAALEGKLNGLVNRAAFTQVGPLVVFTPANIFRAYVMRYLVNFLPKDMTYSFNPQNPSLADDLWDRVLSTLPYPVEEFDIENPVWPAARTPWTRTRHRMDALYGRDFNVANMEPEMLRFIDEHFGAMNLTTVASTVHFARYALMTDFFGYNEWVSRSRFEVNWDFPTFSVHGSDNGLSDVATVDRMRQVLEDAGRVYLPPFINSGAGHQDALVGTKRYETFQQITDFLDAANLPASNPPDQTRVAYPPWIGPVITEERPTRQTLVLRLGSTPSLRMAEAALLLRVDLIGTQILRPDDHSLAWDLQYVIDHMVVYTSNELRQNQWDAFEAPLPNLMPNYDPAHPGNALLVLLTYNEPPITLLALVGHYFADKGQVFMLRPGGPVYDPPKPEKSFEIKHFEKMSNSVTQALLNWAGRPNDSSNAPPRLFFRGRRQRERVRFNPVAPFLPTPEEEMSFSYDSNGAALLDSVIEQDMNLIDGVVPYDPPPPSAPPPATPSASGTRFGFASCQYPGGFIDDPVAYRSFGELSRRLDAGGGTEPRFVVLVGDQVYVDPTAGLFDPSAKDDRYRLPYEDWLRQADVRSVLRRIPSFMLLDDHEIDDNWEPMKSPPDDPDNADNRTRGMGGFNKYQRGIAGGLNQFDFDGFHFFLLDTRSRRQHRKVDATLPNAKLFDGSTMSALRQWLLSAPAPKFVVTPSMLLPRHRRAIQRDGDLSSSNLSALHSDSWDGYPETLREVLSHIGEHNISGVVFLSGDEHRSCVAAIDLLDLASGATTRVHSVHSAALYAPFPFANSLSEDTVENEVFEIADGSGNPRFRVTVTATQPPPGDGMTFVNARPSGTGWQIDCEFAHQSTVTLTIS